MSLNRQQLQAKRKGLLQEMRKIGPWVEGSLVCTQRICGTSGCACRRGGPKHPAMFITGKEHGKTVCLYIPRKLESQAREWSQNYKTLKGLIRALSDVQKQIIRLRD
ncbi:DUF6788 family protein [Candidatus Auribacterota bacterium]